MNMVLDARVSSGTLLKLACENDTIHASITSAVKKTGVLLYKHYNTCTPYGRIGNSFCINRGGNSLTMCYANPFALLWQASEKCKAFVPFLQACFGPSCRGTVVLNDDETKPGNALRPDKARAYTAVYWSFLEYPDWFRARCNLAWMPFGYILTRDLVKVGVSISELTKHVLNIFWAQDGHNFARLGIRLKCLEVVWHTELHFGAFLSDGKAQSEKCSHKGAQSKSPCTDCLNVVGRVDKADVRPYSVHITDPCFRRCIPHTFESYNIIAKLVEDAHKPEVSAADKNRIEMSTGLTYDVHGILWDAHTRSIARLPESLFADWQHVFVASGGVAQYECNQLVLVVCSRGIALQQLDEFARTVTLPKGHSKLPKSFFVDRVVAKPNKHMRGFAGEMLSVIHILGLYSDCVVKPTGSFPRHMLCFDKLRTVVDLLQSGDRVIDRLELLQRTNEEHSHLFAELYPLCTKNKLHSTNHVVASLKRFKRNLSCFATERKHKASKASAAFTYTQLGKSLIVRDLHAFFNDIAEPHAFEPIFLRPPVRALSSAIPELAGMFGVHMSVGEVCTSLSMSTSTGCFYKGDMMMWRQHSDGILRVGRAELFIRCQFHGAGKPCHTMFAQELAFERGSFWSARRLTPVIVPADFILRAVAFQFVGGLYRLVLPSVF